jgi:ketosteroid isomerase-like protein
MVGAAALRSFLAEKSYALESDSIQAEVAASDDFGYTYGRYELRYEGSQETQKGYYVRVWKRDEQGRWRIVLDTATILPNEEK